MPLFLDTRGLPVVAIAICDRCRMKRRWVDLIADINTPGLRVCKDDCADEKDPYRMAKRKTEKVSIRFPRPDEPLYPE